jgi:hypothetical protein
MNKTLADRIAYAIESPGLVVGRKLGPSWGVGEDGYAAAEETETQWSARAVLAVLEQHRPEPKPHPEVDERGKPFIRVLAGDFDTKLFVGDRQLAAIWGPAADGTGEWFGRSVDKPDGERFASRAVAFDVLLNRVTLLATKNGPTDA